jgi:hypothetical protein
VRRWDVATIHIVISTRCSIFELKLVCGICSRSNYESTMPVTRIVREALGLFRFYLLRIGVGGSARGESIANGSQSTAKWGDDSD